MIDAVVKLIDVKSVVTRSNLPASDYTVNPYVGCPHACRYCYASFMKRFTKHDEPWGSFVDVKSWPPIAQPQKYYGMSVFFSSVTDPYNEYEATYQRTRAALEQLRGSGIRLSISTKSDLIVRDLDLIASFPNANVSWSINTLDESFRSDMDNAVSIERRLAAMKMFYDAGVRTTCFISPIFPGITDVKRIADCVKQQCDAIWLENLNLRGQYKSVILDYISSKRPDLVSLYRDIYCTGSRAYWQSLDAELRSFAHEQHFAYVHSDDCSRRSPRGQPVMVNYFYHDEIRKNAVHRTGEHACDV